MCLFGVMRAGILVIHSPVVLKGVAGVLLLIPDQCFKLGWDRNSILSYINSFGQNTTWDMDIYSGALWSTVPYCSDISARARTYCAPIRLRYLQPSASWGRPSIKHKRFSPRCIKQDRRRNCDCSLMHPDLWILRIAHRTEPNVIRMRKKI